MPSKSHKFPKVSLDFQSLVQIIPLRTGALHPLQISAGANAPAAPALTRPLSMYLQILILLRQDYADMQYIH